MASFVLPPVNRRRLLGTLACGAAAGLRLPLALGAERFPLSQRPKAKDHDLVTIAGAPDERGRAYGRRFAAEIADFIDQEILARFERSGVNREQMLRYAAACLKPTRALSPALVDEMEGMAAGCGRKVEEIALLSLHEELWHRAALPALQHCTAVAVGPPATNDGCTYVAQSWDWMQSVYGKSQMLLWDRPEGPSVLSYSYPGLWIGAGMSSAGIALVWTTAGGGKTVSVGVPTYVLLSHLMYQPTLDAVVEEARRAKRAGWFTFVMGDANGGLLNLEGSPEKLAIEHHRGGLARVGYGSREMTGTPADKPIPRIPQCQRMVDLIAGSSGRIDRPTLQGFYGDHQSTICKHFGTLDVMVFNTTRREAYITRGPGCLGHWQRFGFEKRDGAKTASKS